MADPNTQGGTADFWDVWAPYLDLFEDNHMIPEVLEQVHEQLQSPVLVVGGGLGLLVDALTKNGHEVHGVDWSRAVIERAKERRGVELSHADARKLPFDTGAYATTIVATGVVDFMGDEDAYRALLEARRVTAPNGTILVGFYQMPQNMIRYLSALGVMEPGILRRREAFRLALCSPWSMFTRMRGHYGTSLPALGTLLAMGLRASREDRQLQGALRKVLRDAPDAERLLEAVEERVPYRDRQAIERLLEQAGKAQAPVNDYRTCFMAVLRAPADTRAVVG